MPDPRAVVISSAVVTVRPDRREAVAAAIGAMPGAEVAAGEGGKLVVVLEAASRGEAGDMLSAIALIEGVFGANMVFEHVGEGEEVPR